MHKKNGKKIIYSIIILTIFILLMARIFIIIKKDAEKLDKVNEKIAQTESDIDLLREKNIKLRKQIHMLKKGPYIEKIAREQLGMVKKDELALIKINESNENKEEKKEDNKKPVKKSPGTFELCKKNISEFFSNLFNTISIKEI